MKYLVTALLTDIETGKVEHHEVVDQCRRLPRRTGPHPRPNSESCPSAGAVMINDVSEQTIDLRRDYC